MSEWRAADLEALRHRAKNMGVTNSEWYAIAQQSFQQICAFVEAIERIQSNIPGASKSSSSAASSGSCSGSSTVSASPLSSASYEFNFRICYPNFISVPYIGLDP